MNKAEAQKLKRGDKLTFRHPRTQKITKCGVTQVFREGIAVLWENNEHGDFRFDEMDFVERDPLPNLPASVVNLLGG